MKFNLPAFNLKAKLVLIMVVLLALTLGAAVVVSLRTQNAIVAATEHNVRTLANAIHISVRELTAVGKTDPDLLQKLVSEEGSEKLEVSIVSTQDLIINSSNPKLIGTPLSSGLKGVLDKISAGADHGGRIPVYYRLGEQGTAIYYIPVEIEDHLMGYIYVNVKFGDLTEALRQNQVRLVLLASLIFAAGIAFSYFLADRYVRPMHAVAEAAQNVAARGLEPVPETSRRDEVGLLTRSFNDMVMELRRARDREHELNRLERFTALGQLAGGLAHEIKNPLNFISLAVDQIRNRYAPPGEDERAAFLRQVALIKDEMRRLSALIQNFLDYGKPIEIRPTPTDVRALVHDVLALGESKMKSQDITVREQCEVDDTTLNVDAEKLRTCFVNVVSNAIAAMPEGGTLTVTFRQAQDQLEISFKDTGIGMTPEVAQRVFEPFFTTKLDGIGLGLFTSRAIMNKHGGTISIRPNDPPPGAEVLFTFPRGTTDSRI
jgi:signal transduction histidine kinase